MSQFSKQQLHDFIDAHYNETGVSVLVMDSDVVFVAHYPGDAVCADQHELVKVACDLMQCDPLFA